MEWLKRIRALELLQLIMGSARDVAIAGQIGNEYGDEIERVEFDYGTNDAISKGMVISRTLGKLRICIAGVYSVPSAIDFLFGYGQIGGANANTPWNWAALNTANRLYRTYVSRMRRPHDVIELHGHSAGGVIAEILASLLLREDPETRISIDTYGSPCPALPGGVAVRPNVERFRWQAPNDPVPLLPVWLQDRTTWGVIAAGQSFGANFRVTPERLGRFVQAPRGIALAPRGWAWSNSAPVNGNRAEQVSKWISGDEQISQYHDSSYYLGLMRGYRNRDTPFPTVPLSNDWEVLASATADVTIGSGIVLPFDLPWSEPAPRVVMPFSLPYGNFITRTSNPTQGIAPILLDANGDATAPDGVSINLAVQRGNPMAFVQVRPKKGFAAVKVGDQWQVTLDGQIVLTGMGKYRPTAFVRRGNQWLRAIGTRSVLAPASLLQSLARWFAGAAAGEPYASPAINVEL